MAAISSNALSSDFSSFPTVTHDQFRMLCLRGDVEAVVSVLNALSSRQQTAYMQNMDRAIGDTLFLEIISKYCVHSTTAEENDIAPKLKRIIDLFLERGVLENHPRNPKSEITPFLLACSCGLPDLAELFLSYGDSANVSCKFGSVLHLIFSFVRDPERAKMMFEIVLDKGWANLEERDCRGKTVIECVLTNPRYRELTRFLLQRGAEVSPEMLALLYEDVDQDFVSEVTRHLVRKIDSSSDPSLYNRYALLKSLFVGSPGSHDVGGVLTTYLPKSCDAIDKLVLNRNSFASTILSFVLKNRVFNIISHRFSSTFLHEFGHVLASKLLTGHNSRVIVDTDCCSGVTIGCDSKSREPLGWRDSIISAMGPIGELGAAVLKMRCAAIMARNVSKPLAAVLGFGAAVSAIGQLIYVISSSLEQNHGDFGQIAKSNKKHLFLALLLVSGETLLAVSEMMRLVQALKG